MTATGVTAKPKIVIPKLRVRPLSAPMRMLGELLRGGMVVYCVFAAAYLFADGYGIDVSLPQLFVRILFLGGIVFLSLQNKWTFLAGGVVGFLYLLVTFWRDRRFYFTALRAVEEVVYGMFGGAIAGTPQFSGNVSYSAAEYRLLGLTILSFELLVLFSLLLLRRAHPLVPTIFYLALGAVPFVVSGAVPSAGLLLSIAAICGIWGLRAYDKHLVGADKKNRQSAAAGGFAGAFVLVLALILLFSLPFSGTSEAFPAVDFYEEALRMIDEGWLKATEWVEETVLEILSDLDDTQQQALYSNLSENLITSDDAGKIANATPFDVMNVTVNKPVKSIYLRGKVFAGVTDTKWKDAPVFEPKPDLMAEIYMLQFIDLLYAPLYTDIGAQVDMLMSTGRELYLPTVFRADHGIANYDYSGFSYTTEISGDGELARTSFSTDVIDYAANARVLTTEDPTAFARAVAYYRVLRSYISTYQNAYDSTSINNALISLTNTLLSAGYSDYEAQTARNALTQFFNFSETVRADYMATYFTMQAQYEQYVYENYLDVPSDVHPQKAIEVIRRDMGVGADHDFTANVTETAAAVVEYFSKYYTYNLNFPAPSDTSLSLTDAFLYDTYEGICQHFARGAVLILREMGIPARYVTGFLATGFASNGDGTYTATIDNKLAHAWTEVYYDDIGWVQIEATTALLADQETPTDPPPTVEDPENPPAEDPENPPADDLQPPAVSAPSGVTEVVTPAIIPEQFAPGTTEILRVTTAASPSKVYLRGSVYATLSDSTWNAAPHFTPDPYRMAETYLIEFAQNMSGLYTSAYLSVLNQSKTSTLYLPSVFMVDRGLYTHDYYNANFAYTAGHDGVLAYCDATTAGHALAAMLRSDSMTELDASARAYGVLRKYMLEYYNQSNYAAAEPLMTSELRSMGLVEKAQQVIALFYYFMERPQEEKDAYIATYFTDYAVYEDYVYANYLDIPTDVLALTEILSAVTAESGVTLHKSNTTDTVRAVLSYLQAHYTNTNTPGVPSNRNLSTIDAFLTNTKEGFFAHYASAAALLLREVGIPTRYVTGYCADNFMADGSSKVSVVTEEDAYAWIEVYYDGIGWMQFDPLAEIVDETEPTPPEEDPEDTTTSDTESSEPETESSEPETESSDPETESSEPETESSEPETESSEPETEPSEPETESSEPETEPSEPETEPSEPETEPSEPETESSEPETESSEPETESGEPETESSEPETEPSEPETESSEPETESSEPETESSEPETDSSEPDTESSEPETEPSEPLTETSVPENEPSESAPETSEPAVIAPEATTVETDEDGNPIHGGGGEGGDDANIGADGEGGGAADGGVPLITGKMLATIGAIIGGFAVLVGGLFLLIYYARRASDAKEALIGSFERELSKEELRTNTRKLMDFLHAMLADRGLQIGYGELPRTYAARVDTTLRGPSMREVWSLMEKQEFGFGVEADEAKELATYTSNVWKYMKRKTSPWRRAYLHLIRHTL